MNLDAINARACQLARRALASGLPGEAPEHFVFLTLSGAHLYGFPSPDSDLDIRGAHLLPLDSMLGLDEPVETYNMLEGEIEGIELDCVSHDLRKYLRLLSRKNGYVLEQIFSPLVVFDSGELGELRHLAQGAITRHVAHHYRGFFRNQMHLAQQEATPRVKTWLYLFRVLMTAIHLLRTGEVQANLQILNTDTFKRSYIPELIERKMASLEKSKLQPQECNQLFEDIRRLEAEFEMVAASSNLPETVGNRDAMNDFLIRCRRQAL